MGNIENIKICSASLPSAGGFSILQILGILEHFTLSKNSIKEDIHLILEASKYSYLDRFKHLGDPRFNQINLEKTAFGYIFKEFSFKKYQIQTQLN